MKFQWNYATELEEQSIIDKLIAFWTILNAVKNKDNNNNRNHKKRKETNESETEKKFGGLVNQYPNLTGGQIRQIIDEAMDKFKTGGLVVGGPVYDSSGQVMVNESITNRADGSHAAIIVTTTIHDFEEILTSLLNVAETKRKRKRRRSIQEKAWVYERLENILSW